MSTTKRISLGVVGVLIVVIAVVGFLAYQEFYGGSVRRDAEFYKVKAAEKFSYKPYARVLTKFVDASGRVDYAGLKKDRKDLDTFVRAVGWLDRKVYEKWTDPEKVAFWLNAYNALTLKAIIDHYPIKAGTFKSLVYPKNSIRQIPGVWDKLEFQVMGEGKWTTLNAIEHDVLRKKFDEPRIHVALVCAAQSCPLLRNEPFLGKTLAAQLDDQSKAFVTDPGRGLKIDRRAKTVSLSSIFKWFGSDFVKKHKPAKGFSGHSEPERASLSFAAGHLPAGDAEFLRDGAYGLKYLDYDWSLNEQPKPEKKK